MDINFSSLFLFIIEISRIFVNFSSSSTSSRKFLSRTHCVLHSPPVNQYIKLTRIVFSIWRHNLALFVLFSISFILSLGNFKFIWVIFTTFCTKNFYSSSLPPMTAIISILIYTTSSSTNLFIGVEFRL